MLCSLAQAVTLDRNTGRQQRAILIMRILQGSVSTKATDGTDMIAFEGLAGAGQVSSDVPMGRGCALRTAVVRRTRPFRRRKVYKMVYKELVYKMAEEAASCKVFMPKYLEKRRARESNPQRLAPHLISSLQETSKTPEKTGVSESLAPKLAPPPNDPDLAQVVIAWQDLPATVKQAILLLVGKAAK
jgi:hypothetical protein